MIRGTNVKSIIIDAAYHNKLRMYCVARGMKISHIIQDLITLYTSNPKEIQELIDEVKNR